MNPPPTLAWMKHDMSCEGGCVLGKNRRRGGLGRKETGGFVGGVKAL